MAEEEDVVTDENKNANFGFIETEYQTASAVDSSQKQTESKSKSTSSSNPKGDRVGVFYDTNNIECLARVGRAHEKLVTCIVNHYNIFLTGGGDGLVRFWRLEERCRSGHPDEYEDEVISEVDGDRIE